MNKTELLQSILDQADPDSEYYDEDCDSYHFEAQFLGRKGWWAIPYEARHWHDQGVYLGKDIKESLITLKYLGFSVPKYEKKET
jgi:type II restriction/modification system DNA methylase subunit YeeA